MFGCVDPITHFNISVHGDMMTPLEQIKQIFNQCEQSFIYCWGEHNVLDMTWNRVYLYPYRPNKRFLVFHSNKKLPRVPTSGVDFENVYHKLNGHFCPEIVEVNQECLRCKNREYEYGEQHTSTPDPVEIVDPKKYGIIRIHKRRAITTWSEIAQFPGNN